MMGYSRLTRTTLLALLLIHLTFLLHISQAFLSSALRERSYISSSYLSKTRSDVLSGDAEDECSSASSYTSSVNCNDMAAREVVVTCMDALSNNDTPWDNAGLEICFDYSSDRCRAAQGGSLEEFISYAANPTFASMVNAKEYSVENVGALIPSSMTRGAMQTVLIKVQSSKDEERSYLW